MYICYVELRISPSISESPLDFEIARDESTIKINKCYRLLCDNGNSEISMQNMGTQTYVMVSQCIYMYQYFVASFKPS